MPGGVEEGAVDASAGCVGERNMPARPAVDARAHDANYFGRVIALVKIFCIRWYQIQNPLWVSLVRVGAIPAPTPAISLIWAVDLTRLIGNSLVRALRQPFSLKLAPAA